MKPQFALVFLALLCTESLSFEDGQNKLTNITVMGTVFCDACRANSFTNQSYFLPGVKVRIVCMLRPNSTSKEEIAISEDKTTDKDGVYKFSLPLIDGLQCEVGREMQSFCKATLFDNPSTFCDEPALASSVGHIAAKTETGDMCLYNLNALYYRPSNKQDTFVCKEPPTSIDQLNTSLFFWPWWWWWWSPWSPWSHPHIPFFTPPPSFPVHLPPIPFFTPPPPSFPFHFPPIPFFTPPPPPSFPFHLPPIPFFTPPPPPSFPFPFPPLPWTPELSPPPPPSHLFPFPPFSSIFSSPPPPPPSPPPPALPFHFPWFSSPPPPPVALP